MTAGSQGHCLVRDMGSTQRRERATEVPPRCLEEQEARGLAGRQGNRKAGKRSSHPPHLREARVYDPNHHHHHHHHHQLKELMNQSINVNECQRPDAFELWCRRPLRAPWTARRSNQSILKEFNTEYSLGGLMLKLQYFGYLMRRADSLEKTLLLAKIRGAGGEVGSRG